MRISASWTFPDSSSIDLGFCDEQDGFDPPRLRDMAVELRTTFLSVLEDVRQDRTEAEAGE